MKQLWRRIIFLLGFAEEDAVIHLNYLVPVHDFIHEHAYVDNHKYQIDIRAEAIAGMKRKMIDDLIEEGAMQIVDIPQTLEDKMRRIKRVQLVIQAAVGIPS